MFLCALWPSVGIHHKWANKQGARSNTLKTARKGLARVCWIGRAACTEQALFLFMEFPVTPFHSLSPFTPFPSLASSYPLFHWYHNHTFTQPRTWSLCTHYCNTRSYQHFAQARHETAYNPENRCDIRDELIMPSPPLLFLSI